MNKSIKKSTVIFSVVFSFIVIALVSLYFLKGNTTEKTYKDILLENYAELADKSEYAKYISENGDLYPEEILKVYNFSEPFDEEDLHFIYDYPVHKDDYQEMSFTDEELNCDVIPDLYMNDRRWGYEYINDYNIKQMGCAAVTLTMANLALNHNSNVDPVKVIAAAKEKKAINMWDSIIADSYSEIAADFGLNAKAVNCYDDEERTAGHVTHDELIEVIDDENCILIVNTMGEPFGGHSIIIHGYGEDGYYINDPASRERTSQVWPFETIESCVAYYWAVS